MRCTYCGTELPEGALFCGECGRSAAPVAKRHARVQVPTVRPGEVHQSTGAIPVVAEAPAVAAPAPAPAPVEQPTAWHWGEATTGQVRCEQCGATMDAGDIFCGECGAVSQAAARHFSQPRDTVVIERLLPVEEDPVEEDSAEEDSTEGIDDLVVPVAGDEPAIEDVVIAQDSVDEPAPPEEPIDEPVSHSHALPFADVDDVEATRIIGRVKPGERFILQFSTGESSTVYGSGLVGRNPLPEPGEYFDQLVRVIDPSRSVSKTHLEFGQTDGDFWVLDRYSGNGTIVRQPDVPPVRCLPDKRYRLVRGTRVEIGEQFFIVS
ncbi:MAG: hypothetical protein JWN36_620 [Microbacteriaceae bacterium]|nr:hypothetical protein [Microbacteriaceae bacterium]